MPAISTKILLILSFLFMIYPGKRQVLVFYNDKGIALMQKQVALLKHNESGMQERDIEVKVYKMSNAATLVKKWKVPSSASYHFILIGKDGGEKLSTDTVVETAQLFALIDAMPMRKKEMKQNK